ARRGGDPRPPRRAVRSRVRPRLHRDPLPAGAGATPAAPERPPHRDRRALDGHPAARPGGLLPGPRRGPPPLPARAGGPVRRLRGVAAAPPRGIGGRAPARLVALAPRRSAAARVASRPPAPAAAVLRRGDGRAAAARGARPGGRGARPARTGHA